MQNRILFSLKKELNIVSCCNIMQFEDIYCCFLVSNSCLIQRPRGQQPARLLYPQDSPGKNTGVGCHIGYLAQSNLQRQKVEQWLPGVGGRKECKHTSTDSLYVYSVIMKTVQDVQCGSGRTWDLDAAFYCTDFLTCPQSLNEGSPGRGCVPPLAGSHLQQKLCWKRVTSGQQSVGNLPNRWGNNSFNDVPPRDHCGNNSHTKCLVIVAEATRRGDRSKQCSYNSRGRDAQD